MIEVRGACSLLTKAIDPGSTELEDWCCACVYLARGLSEGLLQEGGIDGRKIIYIYV